MVAYCGLCLLGDIAMVSLALSPLALSAASFSWFPMLLRAGCGWGVLIFTLLPVYVASGPAHVSTQCEELKEALNELRISLKDVQADAQICVLERALERLNQGQGLGFLVAKTVIDKGKLNRFAKGIAGLVVTAGPVLLAWGATTNWGPDGACKWHLLAVQRRLDGLTPRCAAGGCKLTEEQQDALEAVVEGFGLGCNATLRVTPHGVRIL